MRLDTIDADLLVAARGGDQQAFSSLTERYRRELHLHCYRLLGSLQDAEDLVQETLLRAWLRLDSFAGRSTLRAWLYKIATNACLDALARRPRRALPLTTRPAADPLQPFAPPSPEPIWLEPYPDHWLDTAVTASPEARYLAHESVTLAFLTALHVLPPRQRVVLLMRDVLAWSAAEVADLLDLTVSAVNSLLHRARVALERHRATTGPAATTSAPRADAATRALLDRYVRVWETADIPGLLALLREDATLAMPPSPSWYGGRAAVVAFASATFLGPAMPPFFSGPAPGRWRLLATAANRQPAFGIYQRAPAGDLYQGMGVQVITLADDQIAAITAFLEPPLLPRFTLPTHLTARPGFGPTGDT